LIMLIYFYLYFIFILIYFFFVFFLFINYKLKSVVDIKWRTLDMLDFSFLYITAYYTCA